MLCEGDKLAQQHFIQPAVVVEQQVAHNKHGTRGIIYYLKQCFFHSRVTFNRWGSISTEHFDIWSVISDRHAIKVRLAKISPKPPFVLLKNNINIQYGIIKETSSFLQLKWRMIVKLAKSICNILALCLPSYNINL